MCNIVWSSTVPKAKGSLPLVSASGVGSVKILRSVTSKWTVICSLTLHAGVLSWIRTLSRCKRAENETWGNIMLFTNVLGRTNQLTSHQDPRSAVMLPVSHSKPSKFCLRLHGQTSHNGRQHLSCQEKGAKSHLRLKFGHLIGFVDFDRFSARFGCLRGFFKDATTLFWRAFLVCHVGSNTL